RELGRRGLVGEPLRARRRAAGRPRGCARRRGGAARRARAALPRLAAAPPAAARPVVARGADRVRRGRDPRRPGRHPRRRAGARARRAARRDPLGPDQLVHGDLAGNVLLDAEGSPVVIDVAPYWRPALWAEATCVLDSVMWWGADPAAIEAWTDGAPRQAMIRSALFR